MFLRKLHMIAFRNEQFKYYCIWRKVVNETTFTQRKTISYTVTERQKFTQYKGVKGLKSRKSFYESKTQTQDHEIGESANDSNDVALALNLDDREYEEVASTAMRVSRDFNTIQNVLIIQPYVKWGPKRNTQFNPDDQLKECEALIRSVPNWNVALSLKVPLETLEKKTLFGSGKMEELKKVVQQLRQSNSNQQPLTCLFISKGTLSFIQKRSLETEFHLPVLDRYSVVVQILRLHATSAEARIQVAMAELPYIWSQARDENLSMARKQGYSLTDTQREILKSRERKLKIELERIRNHRKILRNKRMQMNYPTVAVVGYTNAGKTSLIKALTDEKSMQPRNQLFATLDVTAHGGVLPCNLKIIFMDTVGFMTDLPTGLIECFVTTLEDAILADVIVHVQDLSHDCYPAQKQHVESTLQLLANNIAPSIKDDKPLPLVINVGNKIDLVPNGNTCTKDMHLVSAKEKTGLQDLLLDIENKVLMSTGRRKMTIRVPNGGNEMAWLFKNAAVINTREDVKSADKLLMDVVITDSAMQQFKQKFCLR